MFLRSFWSDIHYVLIIQFTGMWQLIRITTCRRPKCHLPGLEGPKEHIYMYELYTSCMLNLVHFGWSKLPERPKDLKIKGVKSPYIHCFKVLWLFGLFADIKDLFLLLLFLYFGLPAGRYMYASAHNQLMVILKREFQGTWETEGDCHCLPMQSLP